MENPIDVVYVLGKGSKWDNNEIRFSIRSLVANLKGFRYIFIVGEKPVFLQNIIHIQANDIYDPAINADGNIITKVLAACNDERLSDDFLFINDDHLVLKPIQVADVPALHKGNMQEYKEDYWKLNYWRGRLKRTMEVLAEKGYSTFHFDCHTPILFNKKKFKEVVSKFNYQEGKGLTMKSLYGNVVYAETGVLLTDQKKTVFKHFLLPQLNSRLSECVFMSFNDDGLNRALMYWLTVNFINKSNYERKDIEDRVVEICKWLNSDRDYKKGVKLFDKYMKGVNIIKLFKNGETPGLRVKLEYKLERVFDEIYK